MTRKDGKMRGDRLDYAAEQVWSTPRASDGEKGVPNQSFGAGGMPLPAQTVQWSTPTAKHNPRGKGNRDNPAGGGGCLASDALDGNWMTPRSHEVGQYQNSRGNPDLPVLTLTGQAMTAAWSTPSVADVTGSRKNRSGNRAGELLMNGQAMVLADCLSSRPAPEMLPDGAASSPARRVLNPRFVEWLMGWPPEWTTLAVTNSACSATALCRWRQDMLCALLALPLPAASAPIQPDLFGR
jgi:hypothetical protein